MIKIPDEVLRTLPDCVDPSKITEKPIEFHKVNRPVCRKKRPCSLCLEDIPVGTRYVNYVWRRWFKIDMFYYHPVCYKAVETYRAKTGKNRFSHMDVMEWISNSICTKCPRIRCANVSKCARLRRFVKYKKEDDVEWYEKSPIRKG